MVLDMYDNKIIESILETMYSIDFNPVDIIYKKGDKNILFSDGDINYVLLHDNIKNEIEDMKSKFNYSFAMDKTSERISIFISYDSLFEYMSNYEYSAAMIGFFKFVNENDIGVDILCDKNPLLILPEDIISYNVDIFFPLDTFDNSRISKLDISKLKSKFGDDIDVEKIGRFLSCYETYKRVRFTTPNCLIANDLYGGIALSLLDNKLDKDIDKYIVVHPQYLINYPNANAIKESDEILDFVELLYDTKINIVCGNKEVYDILFKIVKGRTKLVIANESGHNDNLPTENQIVSRDIIVPYKSDNIEAFNFAVKLLSIAGFSISVFIPYGESSDGVDKIMEDNMCNNYRKLFAPSRYLLYIIHQYNMLVYPYEGDIPKYITDAARNINTVFNIDAKERKIKTDCVEYADIENMITSIKAIILLYGNPFDKNDNTSEFKYGEGVFDEWKKIIKR